MIPSESFANTVYNPNSVPASGTSYNYEQYDMFILNRLNGFNSNFTTFQSQYTQMINKLSSIDNKVDYLSYLENLFIDVNNIKNNQLAPLIFDVSNIQSQLTTYIQPSLNSINSTLTSSLITQIEDSCYNTLSFTRWNLIFVNAGASLHIPKFSSVSDTDFYYSGFSRDYSFTISRDVYVGFYVNSGSSSAANCFLNSDGNYLSAVFNDISYPYYLRIYKLVPGTYVFKGSSLGSYRYRPYMFVSPNLLDDDFKYLLGLSSEKQSIFDIKSNTDNIKNSNSNIFSKLSDLFDIFYDPEKEAAKDASAARDSAIYDNFTGSGSSGASVGDVGNFADISGSLKGSLNSGVSSGQLFGLFNNTNSDLWKWFSQENYNYIHDIQPRLLRSSPARSDDTDFYEKNKSYLLELLNGL